MSYSARAQKAMATRRARPTQQFGQAHDVTTINGATGCTHTVLQYLALLWRNRWYTHDEISKMTGYVAGRGRRGLRPSEVQTFCNKAGLPYVIKFGMSIESVLSANARGPVGFGHSYSQWPEWYGFRYAGLLADGQPNGYARPLRKAGRTQLSGFIPPNDAHFGCLLGADWALGTSAARIAAWEPNHGTPSRPEKPPYDLMTSGQFKRVYESYQRTLGRTLYALVPTRSLPL